MNNEQKMFAGQCGGALLRYLANLSEEKIERMRKNLSARGQKAEESRNWQHSSNQSKTSVIRTRTGYVYR